MGHIDGQTDRDLHGSDGESHRAAPRPGSPGKRSEWKDRLNAHLAMHEKEAERLSDNKAVRQWFATLSDKEKKARNLPLVISDRGKVRSDVVKAFAASRHNGVPAAVFMSQETEPAPEPDPDPPVVGRWYVWLFDHERDAGILPERITTADLWPAISAAVTDGRKDRPEDARFLVLSEDGKIVNKNAILQ